MNELKKFSADFDDKEKGRRLIDLVITSVLLDAGAGDEWFFTDPATGEKYRAL